MTPATPPGSDAPADRGFLRQNLWLLAATQVGSVCNMLFQMFMMHSLDNLQYGVMAGLFSVVLICTTPMEALRSAAAHQAALLVRDGNRGAVRHLAVRWSRGLTLAAVVLIPVGVALSGVAVRSLQLPSAGIFFIALAIVAFMLFVPMLIGLMQGLQAFGWFAIAGQSLGVMRMIFGVAFVGLFGPIALNAVGAQLAATLSCFLICWIGLSVLVKATGEKSPPIESGYFFQTLAVLGSFAFLMNADILWARLYFDAEESGVFAKAATMARAVVFLPMPVAMVMFPKVASAGGRVAGDRAILLKSIGLAVGLIGFAVLGAWVAAPLIWRIFVGETPSAENLRLIRTVLLAMGPLGLTFLFMNFELAQKRLKVLSVVVLLAVLYPLGAWRWHGSFFELMAVLAGLSWVSVIVLAAHAWRTFGRRVDTTCAG